MDEVKPAYETISISLPAPDVKALREQARREDRSISSVVRIALRRAAEMERSVATARS